MCLTFHTTWLYIYMTLMWSLLSVPEDGLAPSLPDMDGQTDGQSETNIPPNKFVVQRV